MRPVIIGSLVIGFFMVAPAMAGAQARVPAAQSTAIGLDAGGFAPSVAGSDQLENAPAFGGFYEYYVTPRVSLRASAGWSEPSIKNNSTDTVRMIPLAMDVNYNWERIKWHPFVGAGLGAYFTQYERRGESLGESGTSPGVNLGGGIEYFFTRTAAFKGEGRYHAIGKYRGVDLSGPRFTIGLKTYF
jgi:hypothetical protein